MFSKLQSRARAILIFINFFITVFFAIVFMYLLRPYNHKVRQVWARLQFIALGLKVKTTGELDTQAQLLLINHQSLMDITVFENIHPRDIAWVAKKEIADIPVYGHLLKAPRMIILDRNDKKGLIKLLKDVKSRLDDNRIIAIFPEGTRSSGKTLLKFKIGAKLIAEKYKLKIQPVVLTNTRMVYDSKTFTSQKATVGILYLPSFYPSERGEDWYESLHEEMSKALENELSNHSSHR